jgi:ABC-type Zn uptake system ZnuABC Zn-binding protein ZnuA
MNRRAHLLLLVLLAGSAAWRAGAADPAPLRVVSSTTDLDSLVRLVGGPRVTAFSLATGTQDPHELELKPNFIRELDRADLFLQVGLGIENAWLERMMNAVKNPAVKPGQPGNLNFGRSVRRLEGDEAAGIPGSFHEEGNPHYFLDPVEGLRAAGEIRDRLAKLRPEWKDEFAKRHEDFRLALGAWLVGEECAKDDDIAALAVTLEQARGDALTALLREHKLGGHLAALAPHRGRKVVGDHDLWPYFARRFGLEILGYLEPSPGVPPTTKHLQELVGQMKAQDVKIILSNPYFDPQHAAFVARATGAQIVPMAHQPGARPGTDTYLDLVKYNGARLLEALAANSKGQAPSSK